MNITILSNIHGNLPKSTIETDILLLVGNVSPVTKQSNKSIMNEWVVGTFSNWLSKQKAKEIVLVPGIHDFIFDKNYNKKLGLMLSTMGTIIGPKLDVIINKQGIIKGDKKANIFGLSSIYDENNKKFAFCINDKNKILKEYQKIPENIDILICNEDTNLDIFKKVIEEKKPKLVITSNEYVNKRSVTKYMNSIIFKSSYAEPKGFYEPFENVEIPNIKL